MEPKSIVDLGNSEQWTAIYPKLKKVIADAGRLGVDVEGLIVTFGMLNRYGRPMYINMTNARHLADTAPETWQLKNLLATYIICAFEQGRELEKMLNELAVQDEKNKQKKDGQTKPFPGGEGQT